MLLFYAAAEDELPRLRRDGLPEGVSLFSSLEAARRQHGGPLLAVDPAGRRAQRFETDEGRAPALPPSAFENLTPYGPPEPVTAAGGYVLRAGEAGAALEARRLLLIFRRGVWDLPKGKQEAGETVRQCALREVREETGLERVQALGALGPTVHGYRDGARYAVKTTHWFLMETPETGLTPQRGEGIEEALWATWEAAGPRLGYETLQRHHRRAAPAARAILGREAAP